MQVKLNLTPVSNWGMISQSRPIVIAGPCSAETEMQLLDAARQIAKEERVNVLRAGVWKPRTRPNAFEGIGEESLTWLAKAKAETGLPTTTEVANVAHVELALKHKVDILWIGARTTVNPFAVQEIADALKGVDIPVLVKNPVNPDLALWIGALERLNSAGITKLGAIHRGFTSAEKTKYRNQPMWSIPIELKRLVPELPIICDPSHICGNRTMLQEVSQKALDLNFNGLMIESHPTPDEAWSDAAQQITPTVLSKMLVDLALRNADTDNVVYKKGLEDLREEIDLLDTQLMGKLTERMEIVKKIGAYKRNNHVTILQTNRWDEIVKSRIVNGVKNGLTEKFIKRVFDAIHQESINKQTEVMKSTNSKEEVQ